MGSNPIGLKVSMTRAGLEGFGRSLDKGDEVVPEATGNAMAVVRVLAPHVARVIVANPLQVKAIAHAHVKADKIDAGGTGLRCGRLISFRRSGCPTPTPNGCGGWVARRNQAAGTATTVATYTDRPTTVY